jgi:hypothetical protein
MMMYLTKVQMIYIGDMLLLNNISTGNIMVRFEVVTDLLIILDPDASFFIVTVDVTTMPLSPLTLLETSVPPPLLVRLPRRLLLVTGDPT